MFSNLSRFTLDFNNGRQRAWRLRGARCFDAATIPFDRYGRGSVTVLDGIKMNGRTDLCICQVRISGVYYRDNIIAPLVMPLAAANWSYFIF